MSASPVSAAELAELARYLFETSASIDIPVDKPSRVEPQGLSMADFRNAPIQASLDVAVRFLTDAASAVRSFEVASVDPADSYAFALQMVPEARKYDLANVGTYQGAALLAESLLGENASKVRQAIGSNLLDETPPDPQDEFFLVAKALSDLRTGKTRTARMGLSEIGNIRVRSEVEDLSLFQEAAHSLTAKTSVTNSIFPRPGAKRALLYTSLAAVVEPEPAERALQLALAETETLPVEQQVCLFPALASVALRTSKGEALEFFDRAVDAENQAALKAKSPEIETADAPLRCSESGLVEYVDTRGGRQGIVLEVPGVSAYSGSAFLRDAKSADLKRLEKIADRLKDESLLTEALLRIAERMVNEREIQ